MHAPPEEQYHNLPPRVRFEKRVKKDPVTGCWLWLGAQDQNGYGRFYMTGEGFITVARAAWRLYKGSIPPNPASAYGTYYVLHHCDNPQCVCPEHLFLGDQHANMDDKIRKGRHRHGHRYGVEHPHAKLTPDKVRAIRASALQTAQLAREFGVADATIWAIVRGQTWRHVT